MATLTGPMLLTLMFMMQTEKIALWSMSEFLHKGLKPEYTVVVRSDASAFSA